MSGRPIASRTAGASTLPSRVCSVPAGPARRGHAGRAANRCGRSRPRGRGSVDCLDRPRRHRRAGQGTPAADVAARAFPSRRRPRWERSRRVRRAAGGPGSNPRRAAPAVCDWGTPPDGRCPACPSPPIVLDRAAACPSTARSRSQLRQAILDGRIGPGTRLPGHPGLRPRARRRGDHGDHGLRPADRRGLPRAAPGPGHAGRAGPAATVQRGAPGRAGRGAGAGPSVPHRDRPATGRSSSGARSRPRFDFRTGSTRLDVFPSALWERLLPRRVARPRVRPASRATTVPLPGGRPPAPRRAGGLPRRARAVRADARAGRDHGRRPGRDGDRGRLWLGAAGRWPSRIPAARTSSGPSPASASRSSTSRSTIAACPSTACRTTCRASSSRRPGSTRAAGRCRRPPAPAPRLGRRPRALVIEDDCDSELRYEGHPLPVAPGPRPGRPGPLRGHVQQGPLPGLRTGYAVVPDAALAAVPGPARGGLPGPGRDRAAGAGLFIAEGHFERHLAASGRPSPSARRPSPRPPRSSGRMVSAPARPAGAHLVVRIEDGRMTATELAARARPTTSRSSRSRPPAFTRGPGGS